MPPQRNVRSAVKYWVGTLNNYSAEQYAQVTDWASNQIYAVIGKEVGASGTPHLQCFFALREAKRLSAMRGLFGGKFHWEVAFASAKKCSDYCKKGNQSKQEWDTQGTAGPNFGKDAEVFEHGVVPKYTGPLEEGNKAYETVVEVCRSGGDIFDIRPDILIRNYNNIKKLANDCVPDPEDLGQPKFFWFYSPFSGNGKSHWSRAICRKGTYYVKNSTDWWDGYVTRQHSFVIIDDFDNPRWGPDLKVWTDKYAFRANVKGSTLHIRPKAIIITSNRLPSELWTDSAILGPLHRRIMDSNGFYKFEARGQLPVLQRLQHDGSFMGTWIDVGPSIPTIDGYLDPNTELPNREVVVNDDEPAIIEQGILPFVFGESEEFFN